MVPNQDNIPSILLVADKIEIVYLYFINARAKLKDSEP